MKKSILRNFLIIIIITLYTSSCGFHPVKDISKLDKGKDLNDSEIQLMKKADEEITNGEIKKAILTLESILNTNNENPLVLFAISYAYGAINDCENSVKYSKKGLGYNSEAYPALAMYYANCIDDLGNHNEAIEWYKKTIELMPNDFMAHYNLGLAYFRNKEYKLAEECYFNSFKLNAFYPQTLKGICDINYLKESKVSSIISTWAFLLIIPESEHLINYCEILDSLTYTGVQRISSNFTITKLNFDPFKKMNFETKFDLTLTSNVKRGFNDTISSNFDKKIKLDSLSLKEIRVLLDDEEVFKEVNESNNQTIKFLVPFLNSLAKSDHKNKIKYLLNRNKKEKEIENWFVNNQKEYDEYLKWVDIYFKAQK